MSGRQRLTAVTQRANTGYKLAIMASTDSGADRARAGGDNKSKPPVQEDLIVDDERRTPWPFIIAVAIVVLVLGAVGVMHVVRPAEDRLTEDSKVSRVINDYYTAKNAINYSNFRALTCATDRDSVDFPAEEAFTTENTDAREADGQVEISNISETVVNGDRATANVHWFRKEKTQTQITPVTLVKESDDWKVCA